MTISYIKVINISFFYGIFFFFFLSYPLELHTKHEYIASILNTVEYE